MSSTWKLLGKGGNVHVKYATNSNMLLNVSSNLWVPEKKDNENMNTLSDNGIFVSLD